MAKKEEQVEKKSGIGIGKILLIVAIIFIIVPVAIAGIVYHTNDSFKMEANKYLVKLPGAMGDYFNTYPTQNELDSQKVTIAKYLTEIDNSRATDKLILIKNEDEVLYNEVVKIMLKLNSNKTKEILDEIRKSLIKEDILTRTTEQIEAEKEKEITDKAKYFESISPITAINEIEADLEGGKTTYLELAIVFQSMKKENATQLLKYLDYNIREKIIDNFTFDETKRDIEVLLNTMNDNELKLKNAADIYSTESPEKLVSIIGNTETYNINDLALIYKEIGVKKGAKVLSQVEDDDFVHELLSAIKEKEILLNDEDLITDDILKAYKIYRDFDKNVRELTSIYEKMEDSQIAELIKRMIRNANNTESYQLNNREVISITDEDLALSILKNFSERKLASILTYLDTNLATEITKKLSIPNI